MNRTYWNPLCTFFVTAIILYSGINVVYAQSNTPPDVNLIYPDPGLYWDYENIQFLGGALDAEDGVISSQLQWSSNISGPIGSGSNVFALLPKGNHIITATVTDSGGLTSTLSVSGIQVIDSNESPVVTINSPNNGDTFASGEPVTFQGSAIDDYEGDISESLFWISNVDGPLGPGASYTTSQLSVGIHTIKAEAYDSLNFKGQKLVFIEITDSPPPNTAPTVSISSPSVNSSFKENESVFFSGSASDPEEGSLNSSIQWNSDKDGSIGTGSSFNTSNLSVGVHTITASVADGGGLSDSEQIMIRVGYVQRDNAQPTVVITYPSSGSDLKGKFNVVGEVVGNSSYILNLKIGDYQSTLSSVPYKWPYHSKDLFAGNNTIRVELFDLDGKLMDFDEIIVIKNTSKNITIDDPQSNKCSPGKEKSGKC